MIVSAAAGIAGQAQARGERALVHHAVLRQRRLLGVLHDQRIETGGVGQGTAHHAGIGERPLAVGEGDRTRRLEQADLGQLPALQPLGDGGVGVDLAQLHLPRAAGQELDHAGSSIGGSVLGRTAMLVTPPAAAAAAPLSMRSLCSAPGSPSCTRMSTRPGARHRPLAVDHLGTAGRQCHRHARADLGDPAAHDQHAPSAASRPLMAGSSRRALTRTTGRLTRQRHAQVRGSADRAPPSARRRPSRPGPGWRCGRCRRPPRHRSRRHGSSAPGA